MSHGIACDEFRCCADVRKWDGARSGVGGRGGESFLTDNGLRNCDNEIGESLPIFSASCLRTSVAISIRRLGSNDSFQQDVGDMNAVW